MVMGQLDSAMRDSASRQRAGILTMHFAADVPQRPRPGNGLRCWHGRQGTGSPEPGQAGAGEEGGGHRGGARCSRKIDRKPRKRVGRPTPGPRARLPVRPSISGARLRRACRRRPAVTSWREPLEENGSIVSSVMAGAAFAVEGDGVGFATESYVISAFHHARQPLRRPLANKTG